MDTRPQELKWPDIVELGPDCKERYINVDNTPELSALSIQASGISKLKGNYRVGRKNMQSHTLIFTIEGSGCLKTEFGKFKVSKSMLITLPAGTPFLLELDSPFWQTAWFELQDYPRWSYIKEGVPILSFSDIAPAVYHLLALIDNESNQTLRQHAVSLLADYFSKMSVDQQEVNKANSPEIRPTAISKVSKQLMISDANRLKSLFDDIENKLHYAWTVGEMASLVYYSPPHFHRLCKKHFSRSPVQHLIYLRIQRAKYLLRHTQWSITQIATHVGYQDIYNFSKRFSKSVGLPPSQFRLGNKV